MDNFFKETVSFAKKTLIKEGHLDLMIVGETTDGEKLAFLGNCGNEEEKVMFFRMCSLSFCFSGVVRYLAVSEAWMSTKSKKEYDNQNYTPPSQDKNRKECLIISDISYADGKRGVIFEIIRDKKKKILDLEKIQDMDGIEGRMTELLPPRMLNLPAELKAVVAEFVKSNKVNFH